MALLLLGLLLLDLILKAWAVRTLPGLAPQPLIPGLLALGYTLNTGMAWGLLGGLTLPLAGLRLLVGAGILVALGLGRVPRGLQGPLALLAAGALGNAVDGLTRGAVVDYLTSPLLDRLSETLSGRPFPIFNLADVYVSAGVLWLLVQSGWTERRSRRPALPADPMPIHPSKETP